MAVADLLAYALYLVFDDLRGRPQLLGFTDIQHEVLKNPLALQGVGHFRVELYAVELLLFPGHGRNRAARGRGGHGEGVGGFGDFIAVAHPYIQQRVAGLGVDVVFDVFEQRAFCVQANLGVAKLTLVRAFYLAAQLLGHGLHAVADTKYRQAHFEHALGGAGGIQLGDGFRATGQDDAVRVVFANLFFGDIEGADFREYADFTYPAGDQLGVLGAKVENQDLMGVNVTHGGASITRNGRIG